MTHTSPLLADSPTRLHTSWSESQYHTKSIITSFLLRPQSSDNMKTNMVAKERTNFEKLFGFYVLWFRLIIVPLRSQKQSCCYRIYSVFVTLNTFTVLVTVTADVVLCASTLEHVMENFRVIFPVLSSMWVQLSMR